jgi:hypothetical protein
MSRFSCPDPAFLLLLSCFAGADYKTDNKISNKCLLYIGKYTTTLGERGISAVVLGAQEYEKGEE